MKHRICFKQHHREWHIFQRIRITKINVKYQISSVDFVWILAYTFLNRSDGKKWILQCNGKCSAWARSPLVLMKTMFQQWAFNHNKKKCSQPKSEHTTLQYVRFLVKNNSVAQSCSSRIKRSMIEQLFFARLRFILFTLSYTFLYLQSIFLVWNFPCQSIHSKSKNKSYE